MGVVYRGERVELGRPVAIKFLHAAFSGHGDFRERFEREARLMSRLAHPNIVSVIDFGVDGTPYIVMDFVSGETLQHLVEKRPMAPDRAVRIVDQILAALTHAHERGVIHRDIKSANVMLSSTEGAIDHVRLLDFGLAKLRDAEASLTDAVVGTPSYMSPEQASGGKADRRSDLYSTGVLLFELLTARKPFVGEEALAVLQMHLAAAPPRLAEVNPELDHPGLEAVVERCLAKDPDDRYQTSGELSSALERAMTGQPPRLITRPAPARSARVAPRAPRRSGLGPWTLFLLIAGGAAGAAYWTTARPSSAVVAGVDDLIAGRSADEEIRALNQLLRRDPERGDAARRLGDLYIAKGWSAEALAAYARAVKVAPRLRKDRALIANVIASLDDPAIEDRARALLVNQIGKPALAQLRAARGDNPRASIERTLAELDARLR